MNEKKSRKQRNREIEQQKKTRARLGIAVFIAIAAVVVGIFSWMAWDTHSRGWVIRFEGERIPTNELRAFMMDNTEEERENALNFLLESLTLLHMADNHGVGLSEEDLGLWSWLVLNQMGESPFISSERMGAIMATGVGNPTWENLMDIYVPLEGFTADLTALTEEMDNYFGENLSNYVQLQIKQTVFETLEEAEEARLRVYNGEITFDDLMREVDYEWLADVEEIHAVAWTALFDEFWLDERYRETIRDMQAGEITEPLNWGEAWGEEMFMLVYADSREEPDEEALREAWLDWRIHQQRTLAMLERMPEFVEAANFQINDRALDHI